MYCLFTPAVGATWSEPISHYTYLRDFASSVVLAVTAWTQSVESEIYQQGTFSQLLLLVLLPLPDRNLVPLEIRRHPDNHPQYLIHSNQQLDQCSSLLPGISYWPSKELSHHSCRD